MSADARDALVTALDAYLSTPRCLPEEREAVRRMQALARTRADCFERACPIGHFTGSAWIVDAAARNAILLHHRKLGLWLQPGGHADGDGDLLRVAEREANEETGLMNLEPLVEGIYDVDVHAIPAGKDGAHFHFDVRYAFRAPEGAEPLANEESHAVRWFAPDTIRELAPDRSVLRLLEKQQRIRT